MQCLRKNKDLNLCHFLLLFLVFITVLFVGCDTQKVDTNDVNDFHDLVKPQIKITQADQEVQDNGTVVDLTSFDGQYFIRNGGVYYLTGSLEGTIVVDAEDQIVSIILSDVNVSSVTGPALNVLSAGKIILSTRKGTNNTFQDSPIYEAGEEADACIYAPCDLTINGSGILNVHGYYKDGIHSKDVLKILCKEIYTQAKRDGLRGNDGIVILGSDITVESEKNALHTTKTGKPGKGNIEILNSRCSLIGGNYAISCLSDLYVSHSNVYAMGVYAQSYVVGLSYIEEGNLLNE